jgi:AraC family transcriptional regulator
LDSIRRMNEALEYIENNLSGQIDISKAAKIALCSEYHFQRMFSFLAGISLAEYIRRRRLSQAAFEIVSSSRKVIDLAIQYGYSSPDSFSRAFQSMHGASPSQVRRSRQLLKAYPKMTFQIKISGGTDMNYRIVEKEAFRIVGVMKRVPIVFNGINPEIAEMWKSLGAEKIFQLRSLSNVEPSGVIQASTNFSEGRMEEKGGLDHYIGAATNRDCPQGFVELKVPALTWAVFEAVGPFPETLQNVWGRIYSEWFPMGGWEQAVGPEILWIEDYRIASPECRSEIWVPVLKKSIKVSGTNE